MLHRTPYPQWLLYIANFDPTTYSFYKELIITNTNYVYRFANLESNTNILMRYFTDHFDWQSPYACYESEPVEWIRPGYAVDELKTTYATVSVPPGGYSKPIELLVWPATLTGTCRFWIDGLTSADITGVKIEVHRGGIWTTIHTGSGGRDVWHLVYFTPTDTPVDRFRVSFYNSGGSAENAYLTEFDFGPE